MLKVSHNVEDVKNEDEAEDAEDEDEDDDVLRSTTFLNMAAMQPTPYRGPNHLHALRLSNETHITSGTGA